MMLLDKRLHAVRPDLADIQFKGRCDAATFVEGILAQAVSPLTGVFRAPQHDAMQLTQMLWGERLHVFERKGGWAWVQLQKDGYVGYVREEALGSVGPDSTHHVSVPLAHLYPKPDLKTQPAIGVVMNAACMVTGQNGEYAQLSTGQHVFSSHISTAYASDYVAVAEQFLHTPYLWGGKSALGIDCSGLVQVSMQACGLAAPRDSDMQEQGLGTAVTLQKLQRGDLVFWKGHVGILQDANTLLHANGHHMMVVSEPLQEAIARIAAKASPVTAVKRL
jgi:cell wall-associated NlpC family hydrolase